MAMTAKSVFEVRVVSSCLGSQSINIIPKKGMLGDKSGQIRRGQIINVLEAK